MSKEKVILTYGSFDLFHIGHLNLLSRLKALGDKLIVGVSTDEFNLLKGKKAVIPFSDRCAIVKSIRCVDLVIPESRWEQKIEDIKSYQVTLFGMGQDWEGKFDYLTQYCEVVYLPRTEGISTTDLRRALKILDNRHIDEIKEALDVLAAIAKSLD